jgi:hypothetical protein
VSWRPFSLDFGGGAKGSVLGIGTTVLRNGEAGSSRSRAAARRSRSRGPSRRRDSRLGSAGGTGGLRASGRGREKLLFSSPSGASAIPPRLRESLRRELARLSLSGFNIITQHANFDLLEKQAPAEAERLGIR